MIGMLKDYGVNEKNLRLVVNLYWEQRIDIHVEHTQNISNMTDWMEIKKGMRQECVLSPDFFSLYGRW